MASVLVSTALIVPSTDICGQGLVAMFALNKFNARLNVEVVCLSKTVPRLTYLLWATHLYFTVTLRWLPNIWHSRYCTTTLIKRCIINATCCLDYNYVIQLVEVCHWLSEAQGESREITLLGTTGNGIGDGSTFYLLTKFIEMITVFLVCLRMCC